MPHRTRAWQWIGLVETLAVFFGTAQACRAETIILNTSDPLLYNPGTKNQGWWNTRIRNFNGNDNYTVGQGILQGENHYYHNYFTFHLGSLNLEGQQIVSATLRLTRGDGMGAAMQLLSFWDVSTDPIRLNNKIDSPNPQIFDDLGSGVNYGTFAVPTFGDPNEVLEFSLNIAAITDLTSAAGHGDMSIGGALNTTGLEGFQFLFGSTGSFSGVQQLVIDTVPEPGVLTLLGVGAANLLCWCGWRRAPPWKTSSIQSSN
jgi:hypothetical protein